MQIDIRDSRVRLEHLTMLKENEHGRFSSLNWGTNLGYPRATVFINGGDKSVRGFDNIIVAPFNFYSFGLLTQAFEEIITSPADTNINIECYNNKFENGKRLDELELQTTVTVGKNKSGRIFIAFKSGEKPPVAFAIKPQKKWHRYIVNGVDKTDDPEGCAVFAKAYFNNVVRSVNSLGEKMATYEKVRGGDTSKDDAKQSTDNEFELF